MINTEADEQAGGDTETPMIIGKGQDSDVEQEDDDMT